MVIKVRNNMKFSELTRCENGLIPDGNTEEQLCEQITSLLGLEVDSVDSVAGAFNGVVIGEVVECNQHPEMLINYV